MSRNLVRDTRDDNGYTVLTLRGQTCRSGLIR
jgi:hypothetical protein